MSVDPEVAAAMAATKAALMPTVREVFGPIVLGSIFMAFAMGITAMQYHEYFTSGFKDHWLIVAMVVWLAVMDVWFSINAMILTWNSVIEGFFDPEAVAGTSWNINLVSVFTTMTALPVQVFLANRIRQFSRSWLLFIFLTLLSAATATVAWVVSILMQLSLGMATRNHLVPLAIVWLSMSVATDTLLTLLMVYFLYSNRTSFAKTNRIIAKYIALAFQAGVPVTVCAALILAITIECLLSNIHIVFSFILGRLYVLTFLATLNSRKLFRMAMDSSALSYNYNSVNMNAIKLKGFSNERGSGRGNLDVMVTQDVIRDSQTQERDGKSWPDDTTIDPTGTKVSLG